MSDKHQRQHQPPSLDDIKDRPLLKRRSNIAMSSVLAKHSG